MVAKENVNDRLRHQLLAERERLGWPQALVAARLTDRGLPSMYGPTIAKIEAGTRLVRADELAGFADLYSITTDTLLGRSNASDVVWAASRLASEAHRIVGDLMALQQKIGSGIQDLSDSAQRERQEDSVLDLLAAGSEAHASLVAARDALARLADEFPLGGIGVRK